MHLTKDLVKGLPVGDKQSWANDDEVRGFGVLVSPAGGKTYYLRRRIGGRSVRLRIGRHPDIGAEAARKIAKEWAYIVETGGDPRRSGDVPTWAQMFALWLDRHGKTHRKTWQEDEAINRKHLAPLAHRQIAEITPGQLQELHARIGRTAGRRIANKAVQLVRAVFAKADKWEIWEGRNPARKVDLFREETRDRFLTREEIPRFLMSLRADEPVWHDFFLLCLFTGARRGNVEAMRFDQITAEGWRIPSTKTGKPYLIPLVSEARAILAHRSEEMESAAQRAAETLSEPVPLLRVTARRQREIDRAARTLKCCESGYVFPSAGSASGHIGRPNSAWRRILARADIQNLRIHDLRRTLGSWQAARGSGLPVIGASLGHKDHKSTSIYARLQLDPVLESMQGAVADMMKGEAI